MSWTAHRRRVTALVSRHPMVTVFAVSATITALFLVVAPDSLRPKPAYNDYDSFYRPVAESLLHGHGYRGLDGHPALHNPPGYPLLLVVVYAAAALLHTSQTAMLSVAVILAMAVGAMLVFGLTRLLLGSAVGWVAALLWASYPPNLVMASYRFSEVPYTVVLLALCYLLIRGLVSRPARPGRPRWQLALGAGVLVGLAALVRPGAILLPAPVAAALALAPGAGGRRPRLLLVAVVFLGYLGAIAPWEVWASHQGGHVVALSEADVGSTLDGLTVGQRPVDESGTAALPPAVRDLAARTAQRRPALRTEHAVLSWLGQQPAGTLAELLATKAARAWYATNAVKLESLTLAVQLPYLLLAGVGLVAMRRRPDPLLRWSAVLIVLLVGYAWAVTISVLSILRYLTPTLGLLMVPAALAVVTGLARLRRGRAPSHARHGDRRGIEADRPRVSSGSAPAPQLPPPRST